MTISLQVGTFTLYIKVKYLRLAEAVDAFLGGSVKKCTAIKNVMKIFY